VIVEVEALTDLNISVTMSASPAVALVKENTISIDVATQGLQGPKGDTGDIDPAVLAELKSRIVNATTTTVLSGCVLSWTVGGTTVDISAGKILFSTSYPNSLTPTYSIVDYAGATGITPDFLSTEVGTYFYIDSTGALYQYPYTLDYEDMDTECSIGWVAHYDLAHISYGLNEKYPMVNLGQQFHDFLEQFGSFITDGNVIAGNADLTLMRTGGAIFDGGSSTDTNQKAPNEYVSDSIPVVTVNYTYRDALGEWQYPAPDTLIDPNYYNPTGSALVAVPTDKWTIQPLFIYLDLSHDIIYGQTYYDSKGDALAHTADATVINPDLAYNILRSLVIVKQGATDLSDPLQAEIITVDRSSRSNSSSIGASGEVNTASNYGTEGTGLYDSKNGVDLRFRNLVSKDALLSLTYNATNKTIEISRADTFEQIAMNVRSRNVIASTFSASTITKTYDAGSGKTIIVTINFVDGKPTTKVLSGSGLPSGVATTCTYDFSGARIIPLKTYS
jgi:hypothetical protein